ncbi:MULTISPECIES: acetyl-CoA hydrolase/transferase family protein [Selenomonas]|uniref:acetyl-CoA hydrolase/transferase family protein n=1 Tax=Selenomonas TaxID=970 RepID=UPI00027C5ABF|nr:MULTISPECIES: acetyl-CoA hydrolase/transferase family protein [Selenomonas]EJU27962.1 succinate CoA transferase [Selenomonas sp. CM52]UZE44731.1 acetyl-CoA hydrolase/transferase family protein [Selenomonas sputigena]
MIDISDRVRNKDLQAKIVSAEEVAAFIKPGMSIGMSGFTASAYPKAIPLALAERMKKEPFTVDIWTGASTGPELDDTLAAVHGIKRRLPYQTDAILRGEINNGSVDYLDLHLSESAQLARVGYLGKLDIAIVEAVAITEEGNIIPSTSLGNAASYVQQADVVIVEVNTTQPLELEGMHDVYVPLDPPNRLPIPIVKADDRVGTPFIPCTPDKIKYIVPCDIKDHTRDLAPIDENSKKMSQFTLEFLNAEIKAGRMPKNLLPLQSGVGNVANAVMAGFVDSDLEDLTVYTEVIQDGMLDLIDANKLNFASGTAFSPSPAGMERFYKDVAKYKKYLLLRPQEISNSPEVVHRLGVIAMNTALEVDIYGNVNSTHVTGTKMMNGIGGSGDFARNAFLTIFYTPSIAKNGAISSVVPMCSHIDHTEHDVDVIITEQGIADLRGLAPRARALEIINNCVHPDYKPVLLDYYNRAVEATKHAHTPHIIKEALSFHEKFIETKSMK